MDRQMTKDGIKGKLLGAANRSILHENLFSQTKVLPCTIKT